MKDYKPDLLDPHVHRVTFPPQEPAAPAETPSQATSETPAFVPASPFVWRNPLTIAPRPWLYGRHLLRKQVSVTVAPGGIRKSTLSIAEGLAMVTGCELLGEWTAGPLNVWMFNLEDGRDELERRIIGAMMHHGLTPDLLGGRLFVDTGRERELCTAVETRNGATIQRGVTAALEAELRARSIDVLIVDPFVSYRVSENDNGAIDLVAKEWTRLADRGNCAIELVHHVRKVNGGEATSEDGRGASALLAAARFGRVLNRMTDDQRASASVQDAPAIYFTGTRRTSRSPGSGYGGASRRSILGKAVKSEWPRRGRGPTYSQA